MFRNKKNIKVFSYANEKQKTKRKKEKKKKKSIEKNSVNECFNFISLEHLGVLRDEQEVDVVVVGLDNLTSTGLGRKTTERRALLCWGEGKREEKERGKENKKWFSKEKYKQT